MTPVLQVVHRVITRHLLGQAGLKVDEAASGTVTLIQPNFTFHTLSHQLVDVEVFSAQHHKLGGRMMRATLMSRVGAPLELVELEVTEPGAAKVRVRMAASGVCHSDL